jgi:hypothetical protein
MPCAAPGGARAWLRIIAVARSEENRDAGGGHRDHRTDGARDPKPPLPAVLRTCGGSQNSRRRAEYKVRLPDELRTLSTRSPFASFNPDCDSDGIYASHVVEDLVSLFGR